MRVIHTVHALNRESSGLSRCVRRLADSLALGGTGSTVASLDSHECGSMAFTHMRFPTMPGLSRLGTSWAMSKWLADTAASDAVDVLHSHGLWSMANVYPGRTSRRADVPLVVSPHGSLALWPFSRGSKVKPLFWRLAQRPALKRAALFHATCDAEVHEIRMHGFTNPVVVIPIGVDVPEHAAVAGVEKARTILFLGRIHPKKGVEELIHAWAEVEPCFDEWYLDIAGPDHGEYAKSMKALVVALGLRRVKFIGEVSGTSKFERLAGASVFVLPTHSENFGMAVAEALACGTPAIVTKGAPWGELDRRSAGWWIDHGRESLVAALERAMSSSMANLRSMGQRGRDWMLREYQWSRIGELFAHAYKSLLGGSAPPDLVRLL